MLILVILLISVAIAVARGGRFESLGTLPVRHLWLFFIPLVLQILIFMPVIGNNLPDTPIYLASMFLAALALALNGRLPGTSWIAAGLVLNLLVISLNGGYMPVLAAAREIAGMTPLSGPYNNVIPMTGSTALPWLGDIIPVPRGVPFANVFSLGDVLITFGGILFTQKALLAPKPSAQGTGA